MPKLDNWSIVHTALSPYHAPEKYAGYARLQGLISGHPNFQDGLGVTTSRVVAVDGDVLITKSGTRYELGEVDPNYEKEFPNARERLFKSQE